MVRIAAEKLPDSVGLPVRQTKGAMKRLLGYLCQVIQSSLR
jgi:hypothetical protein